MLVLCSTTCGVDSGRFLRLFYDTIDQDSGH